MESGKLTVSEWVPLVISFIADLLSILAFVGVVATRSIRLAIGSSFALLGLIIGGVIVVRAVGLWRSPEGQYYPSLYHRRRIGSAILVLLMAGTLTGFVVDLMVSGDSVHTKAPIIDTTKRTAGRDGQP